MCSQRRYKPGAGWETSELLIHFEQPHPTDILFHYSPMYSQEGSTVTAVTCHPLCGKGQDLGLQVARHVFNLSYLPTLTK